MPTSEDALLEYEAGQTAAAMTALTNSGDATKYTSTADLWSGRSGYTPIVLPDGIATGGLVKVAVSASNNVVDAEALTCYLVGVLTSVTAGVDLALTRPATNVSQINSVTVNSSGAYAIVTGTDGATTAFSETRGAAGGPPFIPVGSIEVGQVRMTTSAAAPIEASEIFQVTGTHRERYDTPLWDEDNADASITFISALPLIHTASVPKGVYASYSDPIFSEISLGSDFVPPETSHSVTSTQIYRKSIGATSETLGQGSFIAYLQDGVTDAIIKLKNANLWFRFYPDQNKTPYILSQGKLGVGRSFPAGDNIQAACTISAEVEATEVSG